MGGVLHLFFAEDFAARIQEILVVASPNQLLQFRRAQALLGKVAIIKLVPALLEEAARFAACRACRFCQELDGFPGFLRSRCGLSCPSFHRSPLLAGSSAESKSRICLSTQRFRIRSGVFDILRMPLS